MSKDNIQQIMQNLTVEKNEEVTQQLAELAKKRKADRREFNGITEGELLTLASHFINGNTDISKITRKNEENF